MAHVSERGLQFIKNYEGGRSPDGLFRAYWDHLGKVWTIGYGHTGPDVKEGMVWTQEQADSAFKADIVWREQAVENSLARPATQGQFDAMVSLAYNVGIGDFRDSTLLRKFNKGDIRGAALQFAEWDRAGGAIQQGLVRRRVAEMLRFLREDLG